MTQLAPALTPTVGGTARRSVFWVLMVLGALLLVGLTALIGSRGVGGGTSFDPEDAAPGGARALAEVLRDQGVDVVLADGLDEVEAAGDDVTVLLSDPDGMLDDARIARLLAAAGSVVAVDPAPGALPALAPGTGMGIAAVDDLDTRTVAASCDLPAAERAGEVRGVTATYTVPDGASGCFAVDDAGSALVTTSTDGTPVTLAGLSTAFSNEHLAQSGNASLAFSLLGATDTLVWYTPGADDVDGAASIGELAPPWLSAVLATMLLAVVVAGVWRGRRLGPLVVEDLPVVVRATETVEGRARLYGSADARRHALDALRVGTVSRLAALLGLGRSADVDAVVVAAAARVGRPETTVRALLVDHDPADDADLVARAGDLARLEREVAEALGGVHPDPSAHPESSAHPGSPAHPGPSTPPPGPVNQTEPTDPTDPSRKDRS